MATIKIEGQDINIPDEIAGDDKRLKDALTPYYPQMANAIIRRETDKQGQMVVHMTKQAGTKGLGVEAEVQEASELIGIESGSYGSIHSLAMEQTLTALNSAPETLSPLASIYWHIIQQTAVGDGPYAGVMETDDPERVANIWPSIEAALFQFRQDSRDQHEIAKTLIEKLGTRPVSQPAHIPLGF